MLLAPLEALPCLNDDIPLLLLKADGVFKLNSFPEEVLSKKAAPGPALFPDPLAPNGLNLGDIKSSKVDELCDKPPTRLELKFCEKSELFVEADEIDDVVDKL